MKVEIDKGGCEIFDGGKTLIEIARRDHPLQQVFGHRRSGLIMPGEAPQHFRLFEPVLVELRRQFDEISRDVGAGNLRVSDRGKKAVQRMAEFVKQGAGIVEAQERRLAGGGLGEIAYIEDKRQNRAAA